MRYPETETALSSNQETCVQVEVARTMAAQGLPAASSGAIGYPLHSSSAIEAVDEDVAKRP